MSKADILNLSRDEIASALTALGEPAWRADQIVKWLGEGCGFDEMTNLPQKLRAMLGERFEISVPKTQKKLVSALDGTVKYLFEYSDGQRIESVVMKYKHGNTVCISTQAGCRMGCRFCASNEGGFARNLSAAELLGQTLAVYRDIGERISNIVLMGIGEPLDNYDNVIAFLRKITGPDSLCIGARHISLSTCGVADMIKKLAGEGLQITLSVSLHACKDEARSALMPVNRKFNIDALLCACRDYFAATGRRISFEYALISGVNDSHADAAALSALLRKYFGRNMPFHVNLIPVNEVPGRPYEASAAGQRFAAKLIESGVNATVRRRLGSDINASCGQLRAESARQGEPL